MRRQIIDLTRGPMVPTVAAKTALRCYVCGERAEIGAIGWELNSDRSDRCPQHRRRPAIATLGELIASKK